MATLLERIFQGKKAPSKPRIMRTTSATMVILGVRYPLKIVEGKRNSARLMGDHIEFTLYPATRENFARYSQSWYRRQARREFEDSMSKFTPEFERLEYEIPDAQLKIYGNMRRAWGRCFYMKGVITLNLKLYRLPKECIDYILLHEMAHFIAHDHGQLFRAILDKIDPQWRKKEATLRLIEQRKELLL
ncbi:MAG: YgjP-like metallopeptidase domain-containing protein [Rikenellaceae bacterium]